MKLHLLDIKRIAAILFTLCIALWISCLLPTGVMPVEAQAGEMPAEDIDPDREASLVCTLTYTGEEETYPLKGARLDLYQVAELTVKGGAASYTLTDDFAESGLEFTGMTSSDSMKAAEKLAAIVKQKKLSPAASGTTNGNGEVSFSGLAPGVYLGVQKEPVTVGGKYKVTCGASLWLAPMYEMKDDESGYSWVYNMKVQPKAAPEIEEIPPEKPTPPPEKPKKPQNPGKPRRTRTGDETPVMFYAIMLGAAALCLFLVFMLDRKKKTDHKKES